MESLWGGLKPIPEAQLRGVRDNEKIMVGDLGIRARKTPGHAIHHVAWEVKNFAFTGDVAGVRIGENGPVMPPCPPPDINIKDWIKSMDYLRSRRYEKLYLTPNPQTKKDTDKLWDFDVVELFIGDDFDNIQRYKEYEVSPQNEWVDLDIRKDEKKFNQRWNSGMESAARIDKENRLVWGISGWIQAR